MKICAIQAFLPHTATVKYGLASMAKLNREFVLKAGGANVIASFSFFKKSSYFHITNSLFLRNTYGKRQNRRLVLCGHYRPATKGQEQKDQPCPFRDSKISASTGWTGASSSSGQT